MPPLCSGLARRPLKAVAPVRIRSGVQVRKGALTSGDAGRGLFCISARNALGRHGGNSSIVSGDKSQVCATRMGGLMSPAHRATDLGVTGQAEPIGPVKPIVSAAAAVAGRLI